MYICSTQVFFFLYILKQNLKTIFSYARQSSEKFDSVRKIFKF